MARKQKIRNWELKLLKSATILEEWLYKKSHLITGQTQGITENIQKDF